MKPTTTVRKRTFMPSLNLDRIGVLIAAGSVALALAPAGCIGGWDYSNVPEGDRCNPYDSHNECASGLQCTVSSWQVANQTGTAPSIDSQRTSMRCPFQQPLLRASHKPGNCAYPPCRKALTRLSG